MLPCLTALFIGEGVAQTTTSVTDREIGGKCINQWIVDTVADAARRLLKVSEEAGRMPIDELYERRCR